MKLFQIEEPDGSPVDADAPGAAIGADIGGAAAEVAAAVGGNAVVLADRDGFTLDLAVPLPAASDEAWRSLFEGIRLRAERALAQPVTHAVLAVGMPPDQAFAARLLAASAAAGLAVLRVLSREELGGGGSPAAAAAILAEDLMPRPGAF